MDILNNLERVGTVQMRYQKHYENDTDELKRYGFFKKSKAIVVKLNTLNPETVCGITSVMDFNQAVYDRLRPRLKHTAKPLGIFLPYVSTEMLTIGTCTHMDRTERASMVSVGTVAIVILNSRRRNVDRTISPTC